MDSGVDCAGEQRGVYFLGEQALAPGRGERPILDRVAAGADNLQYDPPDLPAMRLRKPPPRLVRLRQRQRGEPRVPSVKETDVVIAAESGKLTKAAFFRLLPNEHGVKVVKLTAAPPTPRSTDRDADRNSRSISNALTAWPLVHPDPGCSDLDPRGKITLRPPKRVLLGRPLPLPQRSSAVR